MVITINEKSKQLPSSDSEKRIKLMFHAELIKGEYLDAIINTPEPIEFLPYPHIKQDENFTEPASDTDEEDEGEESDTVSDYMSGEEDGWIDSDIEDYDDNECTIKTVVNNAIFRFTHKFNIVNILMEDDMRRVYSAVDIKDNKPVVIVIADDLNPDQNVDGVPREVRLLKLGVGQSNLCQILGWAPVEGGVYAILMEYYVELDPVISTFGNLHAISKYMQDLIIGITQLKECDICHRDIAMPNVMWDPIKEKGVIIDFDTACMARPVNGYKRDVGRTNYDAPEKTAVIQRKNNNSYSKDVFRYKRYDERADIYSCGVIFWMLLNKTIHSPSPSKLKSWVKKVKKRKRYITYIELDLLVKMLRYDPSKRIVLEDILQHKFFEDNEKPDQEYLFVRRELDMLHNIEDKGEYEEDKGEYEEDKGEYEEDKGEYKGEYEEDKGEYEEDKGEYKGEYEEDKGEYKGEYEEDKGEYKGEYEEYKGEYEEDKGKYEEDKGEYKGEYKGEFEEDKGEYEEDWLHDKNTNKYDSSDSDDQHEHDVTEVEMNEGQVTEVEMNKGQVTEVEMNKSQVTEVETNESQVTEVETNESQVTEVEVETNESQVTEVEVETNKSQVTEVETNKSQVTEVIMKQFKVEIMKTTKIEVEEMKDLPPLPLDSGDEL